MLRPGHIALVPSDLPSERLLCWSLTPLESLPSQAFVLAVPLARNSGSLISFCPLFKSPPPDEVFLGYSVRNPLLGTSGPRRRAREVFGGAELEGRGRLGRVSAPRRWWPVALGIFKKKKKKETLFFPNTL